ncbi:cytochrome P450, partial [Actinomadura sp. BRA 177]|uniref:cytochrome P450 n=1 Tax=Actinomadura sp. BRA 177 TaxID=2745202 RepID=UPI001595DB55
MDFPLPHRPGVPLDAGHLRRLRARPLVPAAVAGREARLVTRHADVRTVLSDARFSRAAWHGGTLFARTPASLALATSDPPTHTRRRRAVQARFTARRAQADRPRMAALAGRLLDGMAADGPPADLLARFATPFPYTVICGVLGVPTGDLGLLLPWVSAMMSAGHHPDTEVKAAHEGMRGYFAEQVAARRTLPGDDLLTELVHRSDLSAEEITVFGSGLLMAGGETTSNFLAMCVLDLASRPELAARLRADPSLIPPAVEEYLRWVWFAGTGGHPHVVLADTELARTPPTPPLLPLSRCRPRGHRSSRRSPPPHQNT